MKTKIKILIVANLIAGSVFTAGSAAMAREYQRWWPHHDNEGRRAEIREDYNNLAQWHAKLNYDLAHHASRKKLAEDQHAIDAIQNEIHNDRRDFRKD